MKKLSIILCALVLLSFSVRGETQEPPAIQIYFFHSKDCQSCGPILQNYLPGLKTVYPSLNIKPFDVGEASNYEALLSLEKKVGQAGKELPVLFIGDQLLSGEQEIMGKLEMFIQEYQIGGAPPLPPLQGTPAVANPSEKTFSVEMAYFYQKGCPKCERANVLFTYLSKRYPHLKIKEIDLNTPDGKRLNETLSNRLNLPAEKRLIAPTVFIGNDFLPPEELTESNVEALIRKYEKVETTSALEVEKGEIKKAEESMVDRFKSLGLLTIVSAGLIDGLNPCAFATLIFFISYLTMVGRKRSEILWVGSRVFRGGLCHLPADRLWNLEFRSASLLPARLFKDRLSADHRLRSCSGNAQSLRLYPIETGTALRDETSTPRFFEKADPPDHSKRESIRPLLSCRYCRGGYHLSS